MAQKKGLNKSVKKKVLQYLLLLQKEGIKLERAIVFGSHVKGVAKPWSDIDVCLVSKEFGKDIFQDGVRMAEIARQIDFPIEPHPFHPVDFSEKFNPLAAEIKKHGIVIL